MPEMNFCRGVYLTEAFVPLSYSTTDFEILSHSKSLV